MMKIMDTIIIIILMMVVIIVIVIMIRLRKIEKLIINWSINTLGLSKNRLWGPRGRPQRLAIKVQ